MSARRVLLTFHFVLGVAASTARGQCLDWSSLGSGANGDVRALAVFNDGGGPALYAGGDFTSVGGVAANRIARWNGTTWSPLGAGLDSSVTAMIVFDDGGGPALYVGGRFATAGTNPAIRIARWRNSAWSAVDSGLPGGQDQVYDFAIFDDGGGPALYASTGSIAACIGAWGTVSKLSGGNWVPIGVADDVVSSLESHDDGTGSALYAGGYFYSIESVWAFSIARWDGTNWSPVGGGMLQGGGGGFCSEVTALAVFDDGAGPDLYAGGDFAQAGTTCALSIARWDGASWSAVGPGLTPIPCCGSFQCPATSTPYALATFDDGSGPGLVAGGSIYDAGGTTADHAVRWNGTAWSALGSGTNSVVLALAVFDDGLGGGPDLYAGGMFATAGGVSVNKVARWRGCGGPATHFCPGDGSAAACPCGNSGIVLRGCQNSQSTGGALLQATGATNPDTVKLFASGELPSAATIFLQGNATGAPGVPFGDGLRCATGILKRLYTKNASGGSASAPTGAELSITARSAALGDPIAPGQRRYYQTYYRDGNAAFCPLPTGNTFNSSSGLKIIW